MTRRKFLKLCSALGLNAPLQTLISCKGRGVSNPPASVLIIGAGAAGLLSGYLLQQLGVKYQILEASSVFGGRMKRTLEFTNFPIPLGAEWLTAETAIFDEIVNDKSIQVNIDMVGYSPNDSYGFWDEEQLTLTELGSFDYRIFKNSSWFDFFDQNIAPSVAQQILFNTVVVSIDYSSAEVIATAQDGQRFSAEKVIVTAPLKVLQDGDITFVPELPQTKLTAINEATVWNGIKVFLEFAEKFYPTFLEFEIQPRNSGERLYYDAAYGQNTEANILGFFAVGTPADPYTALSGGTLRDFILAELDEIFSGQASTNYIKHVDQIWSQEPFIKGAYVQDWEDGRTIRTLSEPVANKVYFAGDAYTSGNDWGDVPAAARSAITAIDALVYA